MEMKVIKTLKYERSFFNIEKMKSEITDDLAINFNTNGERLVIYNQKQVPVDDAKIDELIDKVIKIINNQGTINEYIDDCGATLKITYDDKSDEEYDRGFGDGETDIGTLFDNFIYSNIDNN